MSFTQKILFSLTDHVDTSDIEHKNVFEGEGDRIGLKPVVLLTDNFNDNSLDEDKWNVTGTVVEQNQQIEITTASSWNINGIVSDNAYNSDFIALDIKSIAPSNVNINNMGGLVASNTLDYSNANSVMIHFSYNGPADVYVYINGLPVNTGYTWITGKTYNKRIVYQNPGWKFYIQSPDDVTFSSEVEIYSTVTDSIGPFHVQLQGGHAAGTVIYDDVILTGSWVTSSPSPASVWAALSVGAVVDMSTAKCWMFKSGVIQLATNTDVKFKYAANNGALGSALTLANLRLESDPIISDVANSFKAVGVYASDGTYESKSSAWLEVNVEFPEGTGGGGGKYDKFAKSGIRRVYA